MNKGSGTGEELHSAGGAALGKHHTERTLHQMQEELERRVEARTAELEAANQQLQREVEERRATEEMLRVAVLDMRAVFDSVTDGIVVTDLQGVITEVNEATVRQLGYKRKEDLIGRRGLELIAEHDGERALGYLQEAIKSGRVGPSVHQVQTSKGRMLDVEVSVALLVDGQGDPSGMVSMARDITARRQTEKELDGYRHRLEEMVASRTAELHRANEELEREIAERKQTESALSQRVEQLTSLGEIAELTTASSSLDRVLDRIVSIAAHITDSDAACMVLENGTAKWEWRNEHLGDIPTMGQRLQHARLLEWASHLHSVVLVSDIHDDGSIDPPLPDSAPSDLYDLVAQVRVRAAIVLPLMARDRLLGVLCLHSGRPRAFDGQTAFLAVLANQVATAIAHAQLHHRTLRQVEELTALNRVSSALTSSPNLDEILGTIVEEIAMALKTEAGSASLLLLDKKSDELVFRAVAGPLAERVKGRRFQVKVGVAGWVVREGVPIIVPDVSQDQRFYAGIDEATGFDTTSLLAVPLKIRDSVIGVIEVVNKVEGGFTQQDLDLLSSIAHSTAVAIENFRLMEEAAEVQVLREVDRLRSELVANVSHELRTPLGLIKVFGTTLLSDEIRLDRATELECLHNISDEADKLEQIVNNLLDLSRIQSEYLRLDKQPTDMGRLVKDVAQAMKVQFTRHRLVLDLPSEPLTVTVDPRRMEQVLRNLLSNAIKYSPDGGAITVQGFQNRHQMLIGVSDEGIGIAEEHLEQVFERFFRVDNQVTRAVGGAGLGLSVCQGIVHAHRGRIWAESTLGEGSTFYVSLPIERSADE